MVGTTLTRVTIDSYRVRAELLESRVINSSRSITVHNEIGWIPGIEKLEVFAMNDATRWIMTLSGRVVCSPSYGRIDLDVGIGEELSRRNRKRPSREPIDEEFLKMNVVNPTNGMEVQLGVHEIPGEDERFR